ncbi:hypothetical protein EAVNVH72_00630 [Elizabethkingia anophelis]|nr:hypothetical protein EAVNVH72_01134 [Elizabethkingia anophelis]CAI9678344.1 hypothetical protein EAVNVH72_00630 [Elizabethkingia anophelis]
MLCKCRALMKNEITNLFIINRLAIQNAESEGLDPR